TDGKRLASSAVRMPLRMLKPGFAFWTFGACIAARDPIVSVRNASPATRARCPARVGPVGCENMITQRLYSLMRPPKSRGALHTGGCTDNGFVTRSGALG